MPRAAQTVRIRGRTSELARVRRHVEAWAEQAGLSSRAVRQVCTAVDETVANAIEHGLDDRTGTISVSATLTPEGLAVTVRHRGTRFDPTAPPEPLAKVRARRAIHGYGLHLLRALVDELAYSHQSGTNEVRILKRRAR